MCLCCIPLKRFDLSAQSTFWLNPSQHCRIFRGFWSQAKAKREESFPIELVQRALKIDIAEASASCPVDKIRILNSIPVQMASPQSWHVTLLFCRSSRFLLWRVPF